MSLIVCPTHVLSPGPVVRARVPVLVPRHTAGAGDPHNRRGGAIHLLYMAGAYNYNILQQDPDLQTY